MIIYLTDVKKNSAHGMQSYPHSYKQENLLERSNIQYSMCISFVCVKVC